MKKTLIISMVLLFSVINAHAETYFINKTAISCRTKKKAVRVFNIVRANGGVYDNLQIKRLGCNCLQGWSVGEIVEQNSESLLVKMKYIHPYTDIKTHGWFHISQIQSVKDYKDGMIK